ncbi:MAG TPA: MBL fold metallo-hydrolase [Stellaceae bacterium]|nr:MBL fold metallo-hydrolase [Stellaceae bacterium]
MRVTMLGCGPSWGVPRIGNAWGACDPANPKNRRTRVSVLVEEEGARLLIDTSPDLRAQLLAADVSALDAVIFTHAHADHLHGIDDLRAVNRIMRRPLPIYADTESLREIRTRFGYVLGPAAQGAKTGFYKPVLEPHEIAGPFAAAGVRVIPFAQDHGFSTTLGLRIGGFAYSTDVIRLDEAAFAALAGTELWIVDCMRREPHVTHSHLEQTLAWIARVKPRRAILTHMDETLDYDRLKAELPPGVEPGHDGLVVDL